MGKPIVWAGANAKLINSGDLIDRNNNSLTNGGKLTVTQSAHGWTSSDIGRPLYLNGTTWTLAQADTVAKSQIAGFIYSILDANTLLILLSGEIPVVGANFLDGGGSLTAGTTYFLSPTTAGKVTATEPTTLGQISKPVGVASTTTEFIAAKFRSAIVNIISASSFSTNYSITTTYADVTNASITLTAGAWKIWAELTVQITTGAAASNETIGYFQITDNAGTKINDASRAVGHRAAAAVTGGVYAFYQVVFSTEVTPTSSTVYKLQAKISNLSGTGSGVVYADNTVGQCRFYALKIG